MLDNQPLEENIDDQSLDEISQSLIVNKKSFLTRSLNQITFKNHDDYGNYKKWQLITFISFFIIIPIVWNIIRTIIFPNWSDLWEEYFYYGIETNKDFVAPIHLFELLFIRIFSPGIASIILFFANPKKFIKGRYWIIAFFIPTKLILLQLFVIVPIDAMTRSFIINVIIPIVVLIFYFWNNKKIWEQIKLCFKKQHLIYFAFIIFLMVLAMFLLFLIVGLFSLSTNENVSGNEESLKDLLKTPHGTIILFFSSVIIAPIIEEIVFRKTLSDISGNKLWMVFISSIFFAFLHIAIEGDWIYFLSYFPIGFINGLSYWKTNNITPSYVTHFGNNFIVFIRYFII
ncbi:MAG: lysostaphin resistance A-like protein [Mycoplasmoidaceae bacterium]